MTTPAEPAESPAEPSEADLGTDTPDEPVTLEQARKLRHENAALRARAKEAEQANEALLAKVYNMEQAQVREYAAEMLHDPADLIAAHPDADVFWDDAFSGITRSKVIEAAQALIAERPYLGKPQNAPPPTDRPIEGLRSGAMPEEPKPESSWYSALRGSG